MQNGQPRKPKTVEAERFILRDAAGNVRALLGMDLEGGTFLHLNDQGRNAIELCVKGDGSRLLAVRDREGDVRAYLSLAAFEEESQEPDLVEFTLFDPDLVARVALETLDGRHAGICVYGLG